MSPDDQIVDLCSRWLARHLDNARLHEGILAAGSEGLSATQLEAVDELLAELEHAAPGSRGALEMTVRETVEALALG
jgi:hypothetical protein